MTRTFLLMTEMSFEGDTTLGNLVGDMLPFKDDNGQLNVNDVNNDTRGISTSLPNKLCQHLAGQIGRFKTDDR